MSIWELAWTSLVVGGIIAAIVGLHFLMSESSQQMTSSLTVQENMTDFNKILQSDFNKIGYRDTTGAPILVAKADTLKFLSDIDNNGMIDTMLYYRGPLATRTENPEDFLLYRVKVPSDTTRFNIGLTDLSFTYYDSLGGTTSLPALVRGFTVNAHLEGANVLFDGSRAGVEWKNTYYPRNLNIPK